MRTAFWRFVMHSAWAIQDAVEVFAEWAQEQYSLSSSRDLLE